MALGPRHTKGLLTERGANLGSSSLIGGAVNWMHGRPDGLAQHFGCPPEPCCVPRCSLSCLQGCQPLQASSEKTLGPHLVQGRQTLLVATTRLSQIALCQRRRRGSGRAAARKG